MGGAGEEWEEWEEWEEGEAKQKHVTGLTSATSPKLLNLTTSLLPPPSPSSDIVDDSIWRKYGDMLTAW